MQQAGATPAETVGFTLSTALQYAEDCVTRGIDIDVLLRRFTFFFDISISFFEEIAKFRAARRIWARLARERLGAKILIRGVSSSTARRPASTSRVSNRSTTSRALQRRQLRAS